VTTTPTTSTVCTSLPPLRAWLRELAHRHGLSAELRARLVLGVADLVRVELAAGLSVTLDAAYGRGADGLPEMTVTAHVPGRAGGLRPDGLPLAAEPVPATGGARWRLPLPPGGAPQAEQADEEAVREEELRAVLARADSLATEHLRLKDEIAETNSGVLALYVQLDERDEQLRTAHGKTLRELEDALRPRAPKGHGVELGVHYAPAGADAPTGGDLYDWFLLPDGTLHITVVDALGHGVTSTRGALNVTHAVRTLVLEDHPLESVVARTDEILQPIDSALMATLLLARLHPGTGELKLANGSHPPALLLRADGTARYLEVPGRGVGYPLPGSDGVLTERLRPDDVLVLYTDGLTESRRDPREGERRLVETVRRHAGMPADELASAIAEEMHTVVLHPDDTLVITLRLPPAGAAAGGRTGTADRAR